MGRCIAESRVSTTTMVVTLTYGGGDVLPAAVLTYSDVQKYFKRLRNDGYRFKYLCAGEYGKRKGRAHWHAIIFFDGVAPERVLRQNIHDPYWPHGYSFWDTGDLASFRYTCKYVVKDLNDQMAQSYIAMSRRPFIGRDYFALLAQQYVDMRLAPQNFYYRFEESRDINKKIVQHFMHGAVGRFFLAEFVRRWVLAYGDFADYPNSDIVDAYMDSICDYAQPLQQEQRRYGVRPYFLPEGYDGTALWSEFHNTYFITIDCERYFWVNRETDGTIGEHAWRSAAGRALIRLQAGPPPSEGTTQEPSRYEQLLQRFEKNTGLSKAVQRRLDRSTLPMVGQSYQPRRLQYLAAMSEKFLLDPKEHGSHPG